MKIPETFAPFAYGFIAGGVALAIVGFSWGGWVTGGGAETIAADRAHDEVVLAMVPVCMENARTDPDRAAKLETVEAADGYRRRNALMDTGWATMPGAEDADRDLAAACLEGMELAS